MVMPDDKKKVIDNGSLGELFPESSVGNSKPQTPIKSKPQVEHKIPSSQKQNKVFNHEQLKQFKTEDLLSKAMSDVRGMFNGSNYAETMQMLADRYGATDTNSALIDFLYSEAALSSILNDINKKGGF